MVRQRTRQVAPLMVVAAIGTVVLVNAGSLTPPAGPITSTMKDLQTVEPRTPITALPFTINQSGSYYLTGDLEAAFCGADGLVINASDVTLDLNGFSIFHTSACANDGVTVTGIRRNIVVRNGTVRGFNSDGIDLGNASNCRVDDVHVADNTRNGLWIFSGAVVTRCTARDNGMNGIVTIGAATIENCSARGNGLDGIVLSNNGGSISNCTAHNNGDDGISAGDGVAITNCTASLNTARGIYSVNGDATIIGCTATQNVGNGIEVGSRSTIQQCTSKNNAGHGIAANGECFISQNNCVINGGSGVRVNLSGNRIEANNVVGNSSRGIEVVAAGNLIIRNSARTNASGNYSIAGGNTVGPTVTAATIAGSSNPHANYDF